MPDKWAVVSGDWSTAATWNDGILPDVNDDVYSNGFTVSVSQEIAVKSIRNGPFSNGVAGGSFEIPDNIRIKITANLICEHTTNLLNGSSARALDIIGNLSNTNSTDTASVLILGSSGSLNKAPSIRIAGNLITANCIRVNGGMQNSPFIFIDGDVLGDNSNFASVSLLLQASAYLFIHGKVVGGTAATAYAVQNLGDSNIYVFGAIINNTATAISNTGSGSVVPVPIGAKIPNIFGGANQ